MNLFERSATSSQLFLDRLDGCRPYEWFGAFIPGGEEVGNRGLKLFDAEEHAALNGLIVEMTEPALDKIHPACAGGYEVRNEARMALKPRSHFFVFVGAVVVHDEMERHVAGKLLIEAAQELQKLLVPMSLVAFADNLAL